MSIDLNVNVLVTSKDTFWYSQKEAGQASSNVMAEAHMAAVPLLDRHTQGLLYFQIFLAVVSAIYFSKALATM